MQAESLQNDNNWSSRRYELGWNKVAFMCPVGPMTTLSSLKKGLVILPVQVLGQTTFIESKLLSWVSFPRFIEKGTIGYRNSNDGVALPPPSI